jgi:general secretion pathway protein A
MYEAYWQLGRRPFDTGSDPSLYYPCEAHQGALLKLRYAIENARGTALLTGAPGVGKSVVIHALKRQLHEQFEPFVHVVYPQMPAVELLAYLADELNPARSLATTPSIRESIRRIEQTLVENTQRGGHAIVVIDEAHLLTDRQTWEALRLLNNFESEAGPRLSLVICGQPSLLPTFDRMPQWEERLGVKCLLRPFTQEETMAYVSHRLTAAGATEPIFDTKALETVHAITQGNARKINRLCDLALLIAFAEEQTAITAAQVETVAGELAAIAPE